MERARPPQGATARAIIIGLIATPLNVWWVVKSFFAFGWLTGEWSLFDNVIAELCLLVAGNQLLKRIRPSWALGAGEILTIYVMLVMSTALMCTSWGFGGALAANITYPFWTDTAEAGWEMLVHPYLPSWLTVTDRAALEGFFGGEGSPYAWGTVRQWLVPVAWWTAFLTALTWVCMCLNSIVRRRWADEEKLAFPMTVLPVQLTDERSGLLRSKLWWTGIGLSAGLSLWNTLAGIWPSLPVIPFEWSYDNYLRGLHPWDLIRYKQLLWMPAALGLCYLIPLDLGFSLLVFELLWKAEYVLAGYLGWCTSSYSGFPYGDQQIAGGMIAIVASTLWLDRRFLVQVLRRSLGLPSRLTDDGREALRYREAVFGALLAIGFLWWFLVRGGMPYWVAIAFLGLYFLMVLFISRVRAQLGPPSHELDRATPNWVLSAVAGSRAMGPSSLGMFALLRPYLQVQCNHPAPGQLESLKMAEGGAMQPRRVVLALTIVVPLTALCYFWSFVHLGHRVGLASARIPYWFLMPVRSNYEMLTAALQTPSDSNASESAAMGFGLAFTVVLMMLRMRFEWWPVHPVAFPLTNSMTVGYLTPVIFVAWIVKLLLLRYGGLRAHRVALPFFLGLIAGGMTFLSIQALFFLITRLATPNLW